MKSIKAVYGSAASATDAIRALNEAHVETDEILVFAISGDERRAVPVQTRVGDIRGAQYGAIAGLLLGGVCAWLAEIGVIVDPGIGFIADTSLVTALRFLLMGAGTGALTGYIVGLAIWRVEICAPEAVDELTVNIRASERRLSQMTEVFERTGAIRVEVSELTRQ